MSNSDKEVSSEEKAFVQLQICTSALQDLGRLLLSTGNEIRAVLSNTIEVLGNLEEDLDPDVEHRARLFKEKVAEINEAAHELQEGFARPDGPDESGPSDPGEHP